MCVYDVCMYYVCTYVCDVIQYIRTNVHISYIHEVTLIKIKVVKIITFARFPGHEEEVGELARKMGFSQVSISSQVMPMVRIVPRGYTGM